MPLLAFLNSEYPFDYVLSIFETKLFSPFFFLSTIRFRVPSVCSFLSLSVPFRPNRRQNQSPPASEMEHGRNQGRASERAESRREQKLDASFSLLSSFPRPPACDPFHMFQRTFRSRLERAAHRGGCRRPPRPDSGFSLHKARGEAAKAKRPQDFGEVSMPWSEMGVSVSVGEGAHRGCVVTVVAMALTRRLPLPVLIKYVSPDKQLISVG